jgi:hypothetical protein
MLNRPILGVKRGTFDAAVIELVDDYVTHMNEIVRRVAPYLRRDGEVVLVAFNLSWTANAEHMGRAFAAGGGRLVGRNGPRHLAVSAVRSNFDAMLEIQNRCNLFRSAT